MNKLFKENCLICRFREGALCTRYDRPIDVQLIELCVKMKGSK